MNIFVVKDNYRIQTSRKILIDLRKRARKKRHDKPDPWNDHIYATGRFAVVLSKRDTRYSIMSEPLFWKRDAPYTCVSDSSVKKNGSAKELPKLFADSSGTIRRFD